MKNGKVSTPTMILLLLKHAGDKDIWTATAPENGAWSRMSATARAGCVYIYGSGSSSLSVIPGRDDWSIHKNGIIR
jgi:hypothetical protein